MKRIFVFSLPILLTAVLRAEVRVPEIFSNHAVLQRSKATAVFGAADPGENVTVTYGGISASGTADREGRFLVKLDLSAADDNGKKLVISGKNKLVFDDVIVGEVWLCAGQSNMAMKLVSVLNASEVIRTSANRRIRMFLPRGRTCDTPKKDIPGEWLVASPKTAGQFTAVGYYFARALNRDCGLSVGLINPSCGGSLIEAWICDKHTRSASPAAAEAARKDLYEFSNYRTLCDEYVRKLQAWEKELNWVDDPKSSAPPADAVWRKAPVITGSFDGAGVVWFRKTVELQPKDIQGGSVPAWIGRTKVETKIFWDGRPAATLTRRRAVENWPFRFNIPTKPGKHTMTIRVSAVEKKFGFPYENMIAGRPNASGWEFCREKDFPAASAEQLAARPQFLNHRPYQNQVPNQLWNSMIHPILPYTVKGTLWYQGESNAGVRGRIYGEQLKALVKCLREDFKNPEMRFYAVQLPDHQRKAADPNLPGYWSEIRDQQSRVIKTLPFAAEIVTLGCGEAEDIHPMDKQPVGERLAAVAMKNDYGKTDAVCDYPTAVKAVYDIGNQVKVYFTGCPGGLIAGKIPETYWVIRRSNRSEKLKRNSPAGQLEGFAVCGKDGKWFWADAEIDGGDSVKVRSAKVAYPVRIRYAWQNNPTCNLFNGAGLPAAPFMLNIGREK